MDNITSRTNYLNKELVNNIAQYDLGSFLQIILLLENKMNVGQILFHIEHMEHKTIGGLSVGLMGIWIFGMI